MAVKKKAKAKAKARPKAKAKARPKAKAKAKPKAKARKKPLGKGWTKGEIKMLRMLYKTKPASFIAKQLKRSLPSVRGKISALGLTKPASKRKAAPKAKPKKKAAPKRKVAKAKPKKQTEKEG